MKKEATVEEVLVESVPDLVSEVNGLDSVSEVNGLDSVLVGRDPDSEENALITITTTTVSAVDLEAVSATEAASRAALKGDKSMLLFFQDSELDSEIIIKMFPIEIN